MKTNWGNYLGLVLGIVILPGVLAGPSFAAGRVGGQQIWLALFGCGRRRSHHRAEDTLSSAARHLFNCPAPCRTISIFPQKPFVQTAYIHT